MRSKHKFNCTTKYLNFAQKQKSAYERFSPTDVGVSPFSNLHTPLGGGVGNVHCKLIHFV